MQSLLVFSLRTRSPGGREGRSWTERGRETERSPAWKSLGLVATLAFGSPFPVQSHLTAALVPRHFILLGLSSQNVKKEKDLVKARCNSGVSVRISRPPSGACGSCFARPCRKCFSLALSTKRCRGGTGKLGPQRSGGYSGGTEKSGTQGRGWCRGGEE